MTAPTFNNTLNYTNAVWDDGEWVSWAEINRFIEGERGNDEEGWDAFDDEDDDEGIEPKGSPESETSMQKLDRLEQQITKTQEALERGEDIGGRIGEMGELYAEARFRFKRHRKCAQGSDGKIGCHFVEVKTISPWKKTQQVRVKRSGNWSKLIVVKINQQWVFDARMFDREELGPGNGGKHAKVMWNKPKHDQPI